jgi:UDP-N-acetylmuramate dehydrogenase
MLHIEELYPLKKLNTFGIEVYADFFLRLQQIDEVKEFVNKPKYKQIPSLILGGGSNLLFTGNFNGIVVKPDIQGIEILNEDSTHAEIRCGAGVEWDQLVAWTIENKLIGLENLSMIPGCVGASPVQNIGAYGVEVKDFLLFVEGYRLDNGSYFKINNYECEFGYRHSIFKTLLLHKTIITHVSFRLTKNPEFRIDYGTLASEISKLGGLSHKNIRQAVINIRTEKLPNPELTGNAGSFFKNPVVLANKAQRLKQLYPDIHLYPTVGGNFKIPAAFLIESCGWKGYREGDAGVHSKQPLVLINHGNVKGMEILNLAYKIIESVRNKFQIDLEMEVNIVA